MKAEDIVSILRKKKGLSETEANKQAHTLLASVKGKHPRLEITSVVIKDKTITVCLANGIQAKFEPTLPVPIWKYPEGTRTTDPKMSKSSYMKILPVLESLRLTVKSEKSSKKERQRARAAIEKILSERGAKSIKELSRRIMSAVMAENGDRIR